ncbi:MAG: hypothetical protein IK031_03295 [Bacteroidales bacterium]|nr:hypothetical protein [Bacteroidales bacterium]
MKKILTILSAVALLCSCATRIENPTHRNLIGTWDLVSETTVYKDGSTVTNAITTGEYLIITEDRFTVVRGNVISEYPFTFENPRLYLAGVNVYNLEFVSHTELKLNPAEPVQDPVSRVTIKYRIH